MNFNDFYIKNRIIVIIMKKEPYCCIRCNYVTPLKGDMNKHLYKLKKTCPATKNDIELTNEIKDYILANRIYHLPKEESKNIINNIQNINTINNFIANMDPIEKISKYIVFKDIDLCNYSDTIENGLRDKCKLLENKRCDIEIDNNGFIDIIDQVSSLARNNMEEFNIIFDEKYNKLKLYEDGSWNESIITSGIKTFLTKIQEFYWDNYEFYLIRKIELANNFQNKNRSKELIIEYYKFIGCYDIEPYSKQKSDPTILYDEDSDDESKDISDKYYSLYIKTRDAIQKSYINTIKKQVIDILKKNSQRNINELNKKVTSLFHMEEEFKNTLLIKPL